LAANTTGFDDARPAHDERDAVAAFPGIALVTAQRATRIVALLLHHGRADIGGTTVVAGKDHQRIVRRAALFKRREHATHQRVSLHHQVRVGNQAALALPLGVDRQRRVRRGERQIEHERLPLPRRIS